MVLMKMIYGDQCLGRSDIVGFENDAQRRDLAYKLKHWTGKRWRRKDAMLWASFCAGKQQTIEVFASSMSSQKTTMTGNGKHSTYLW